MHKSTEEVNEVIGNLLVEAVDSDEAVDDLLLLTEIRQVEFQIYFSSFNNLSASQLAEIEDESALLEKLAGLFQLVQASSTIFRPYHQNFVTVK